MITAQQGRNEEALALLTKAIASEEALGEHEPAEDLLNMAGMERRLAFHLASQGVVTMEDLADLAVPDLQELAEELDEETAAALIMTARAPWFEEAEE